VPVTDDLVQRLRHPAECPSCGDVFLDHLSTEAADEIERLRAALHECINLANRSSIDDPPFLLPNQIVHVAKGALRGVSAPARTRWLS
jgi:hypothetical protein